MAAFMTPKEVAARWQCSARHVRRLCASGELQAMRLGLDAWRISVAAVEAFEAGHTSSAETVQPAPTSAPREVTAATAVDGFALPADFEPVFPELWGMEPATTAAASSAAGRGRSTGKKRAAVSSH